MNEVLLSFAGIELIGEPEIDAISRRVAEAYRLAYLVVGPSSGRPRPRLTASRVLREDVWVRSEVTG